MKTTQKRDPARVRAPLSICSLALALALATGACGQRGPLYLPAPGAGDKAAPDTAAQDERNPENQDQESDREDETTP